MTTLPYGYRWATIEDYDWTMDHPEWFELVRNDSDNYVIAVMWDCMIEFGMDHDHDHCIDCGSTF
jgi:hypothetical protein